MAARNIARVIAAYGEHEPAPTAPVGGSLRNALDIDGVRKDVAGIEADGGRAYIFVNGVLVADLATYEAMAQKAAE